MTNQNEQENHEGQKIPLGQLFMDNLLLLFVISMLTGFLIFNLWGIMQILSVPIK